MGEGKNRVNPEIKNRRVQSELTLKKECRGSWLAHLQQTQQRQTEAKGESNEHFRTARFWGNTVVLVKEKGGPRGNKPPNGSAQKKLKTACTGGNKQ